MSNPRGAGARNPLKAEIRLILRRPQEGVPKRSTDPDADRVRLALKELAEQLQQSEVLRAHREIRVASSDGTATGGDVPSIAFRGARGEASVTLLFSADRSGLHLTVSQGVKAEAKKGSAEAAPEAARHAGALSPAFAALEAHGFTIGDTRALPSFTPRGRVYEPAAVVCKHYRKGSLPDDAALLADLDAALTAYDRYVAETTPSPGPPAFDRRAALAELTAAIAARGFVFAPWQIAAYVTALRTKPFVILAGVSGTGKSILPKLCAELTGGASRTLPVRPDWTDSADVLGFTDLSGRFQPGALLRLAEQAAQQPERHHVCIVDEMNLARVEQYFAEVLSRMEDRREGPDGRRWSEPLLAQAPPGEAAEGGEAARWAGVRLPENLALVGTVNMDETTHGFSRKVLDRAFTLEISDIDLGVRQPAERDAAAIRAWPASAFRPLAVRLGEVSLGDGQASLVDRAVKALVAVNGVLARAQLQVGYRVRDEVALFLLHAEEVRGAWRTRAAGKEDDVDPLDLALTMKILPRVAGGSASMREIVTMLFGWATGGTPWATEEEAAPALDAWKEAGRPASVDGASFPRMAARLALMLERLLAEGYTSFWA